MKLNDKFSALYTSLSSPYLFYERTCNIFDYMSKQTLISAEWLTAVPNSQARC